MEITRNTKVMVSGFLKWLLLLTIASLATGSVCPQGKQFLQPELQICINCTICDNEKDHVVLRPCEVHRDTICGPLSELTINWNFLRQQPQQGENRLRHAHHRYHHKESKKDRGVLWDDGEQVKGEPTKFRGNGGIEQSMEVLRVDVTSTEVPFSSAETLIWDWQAIALTVAVFACILFFIVIALYSLHQAKQWRRLKENFEADVEELSARLSLMAASSSEKGDILEPKLGPVYDGNYLDNRCLYLEQLLNVRKDTKISCDTGNVYIEESTQGKS